MADLKTLWKSAKSRHGTNEILAPEVVRSAIRQRTGGLMDKLKKRIRIKIWITIFSIAAFLAIIILTNNTTVRILLGFVEAGMVAGLYFFFREFRELKTTIDFTQDPAGLMDSFLQRIRKILKYEELVGLTLYPPSFSGGFVLGAALDPDSDPYFSNPVEWIIFIVLLVAITPLCHWLARWMNKKAFGKLMQQLEENIEEFRSLA